jgi:glycosyltransferase involved in cell wall biosynthesis
MACGATVLASDTAPVREVVVDGENGLLVDFFDVEALAARAVEVLEQPGSFAPLGVAAKRTIDERYSLDLIIPQMGAFYEEVVAQAR